MIVRFLLSVAGIAVLGNSMTNAEGIGALWPGDINGNGGPPNLADYATFQRCFGAMSESADCTDLEADRADFVRNGMIDARDFRTFSALWVPECMYIPCGSYKSMFFVTRCGSDCLPPGLVVPFEEREPYWARTCQGNTAGHCTTVYPRLIPDRIQVIRDQETLDETLCPGCSFPVDFATSDVILILNQEAASGYCWEAQHCVNGVVDLDDGRRVVVVGFVEDGPVICLELPGATWRTLLVPRSDRPVVMFFIEATGDVTVTGAPVCE